MDQELVTKLALDARLVEANERKNRIRFRFIFINLRDVVEKKHYKYFQLYMISFTKAAWRWTPPGAIPWGYTGSQAEQEPTASCSQEEEEHCAGLQKCMATKMQHGSPRTAAQTVTLLPPCWSAPAMFLGQSYIPPPHACPHMASVMNVQRRVTRMAKIRTDKKTLAVQLKKKEKEDAHRPPNTQMIALKKESASDLFNSTGEKRWQTQKLQKIQVRPQTSKWQNSEVLVWILIHPLLQILKNTLGNHTEITQTLPFATEMQ